MKFLIEDKKALFIYKDMKSVNVNESINILLSPEFYWVQREKLPVKFTFQAKKFSNSVFDGLLPEGEYEYVIKKINQEFIFIAFDENRLIEFLEKIGIKKELVSKIYFTEFEEEFVKSPIALESDKVLTLIDNTPTILNRRFLNQTTIYPLNKSYKPNSIYTTFPTISFISKKQLFTISSLFIIASLLNFLQSFRYFNEKNRIENQYEKFLKETSLPTSFYQLDNIHKKFKNIHINEKKKRTITSEIIKTITKNQATITLFDLNKNALLIEITSNNKSSFSKIKGELNKNVQIVDLKDKLQIKVNIDES